MLLRRALRDLPPLASRGCSGAISSSLFHHVSARGYHPGAASTAFRTRGRTAARSLAVLSPTPKPLLAEAAPSSQASTGVPLTLPLAASPLASLPPEETPQQPPATAPATPERAAALAAALLEHLKYLDPPALRGRLSVFLDADGNLAVAGAKALLQQTLPPPAGSALYSDEDALGVVRCLARGSGAPAAAGNRASGEAVDGAQPNAGAAALGTAPASLSSAEAVATYLQVQAAVDAAASVVDPRVLPVFATLTLSFAAQGTQFPVNKKRTSGSFFAGVSHARHSPAALYVVRAARPVRARLVPL